MGVIISWFSESSVHGFPLIARKDSHYIERIFWLIVICLSIYLSFDICSGQWDRYKNNPTVLSIENNYHSWEYNPIGITICSNYKDISANEKIVKKIWDVDQDDEKFSYYMKFLEVLVDVKYNTLSLLEPYLNDSTLRDINFLEITREKSHDMLSKKNLILRNYTKLKTHLRLALNRTKLLEKKKTELTQKARKEIADYLATGKIERARIRVEHIIREDYLVEAMEIVEMYCDLILARFGLVTQMTDLDDGIAEAVSSLVWVSPRLQTDIQELKIISDIFITKYGKPFAEQARTATGGHRVSEKLMHKLAIQAPPKLLVEKYLIEIAKNYNIEYEPDPQVMKDDLRGVDGLLIDLSTGNNLGGPGTGGQPPQMGFIGYPTPPALPDMPQPPTHKPFNYPPAPPGGNNGGGMGGTAPPFAYNIPPNPPGTSQPPYPAEVKDLNVNANFIQKSNKPKPQPRSKIPPEMGGATAPMDFPALPNVPSDLPDPEPKESDEINFDDLSRRFEELKKRK